MISFIIPTYKNTHSLNKCVSEISLICSSINTGFEILIVDNELEEFNLFNEYKNNEIVRYYKNPNKGAHQNRKLGVYNCIGETIVLVDDDNYITKEYVQFILHTKSNNQKYFIGCATKEYEKIDWSNYGFNSYSFACGSLENHSFKDNIPVFWGAGMCMDRKTALQIFSIDLIVEGRINKKKYIMSGEDHEISLRAYLLNIKSFYFNQIGLYHDFDSKRLNDVYYSQLQVGFSLASNILNLYYNRISNSYFVKYFFIFYLWNSAKALLKFLLNPFSLERKLIFFESIQFSKKKLHYNIVNHFIITSALR